MCSHMRTLYYTFCVAIILVIVLHCGCAGAVRECACTMKPEVQLEDPISCLQTVHSHNNKAAAVARLYTATLIFRRNVRACAK